jgi:hypothetical protein
MSWIVADSSDATSEREITPFLMSAFPSAVIISRVPNISSWVADTVSSGLIMTFSVMVLGHHVGANPPRIKLGFAWPSPPLLRHRRVSASPIFASEVSGRPLTFESLPFRALRERPTCRARNCILRPAYKPSRTLIAALSFFGMVSAHERRGVLEIMRRRAVGPMRVDNSSANSLSGSRA